VSGVQGKGMGESCCNAGMYLQFVYLGFWCPYSYTLGGKNSPSGTGAQKGCTQNAFPFTDGEFVGFHLWQYMQRCMLWVCCMFSMPSMRWTRVLW